MITCLEEEKIIDPLTGKVGRYVQYACDGGAKTGAWAGKEGQVTGVGGQVLTHSRWLEGRG